MHLFLIYAGIFCGIVIEGEMVMITSVIAAHHGHLNLWIVMAIGLIGTYGSDTFYFFLGRRKGRVWLNKHERFKDKYAVIDRKIKKYPILIFLGYRFMYGFRSIAPTAIGASSVRTSKFLILSATSTIIWGISYGGIGYLFGEVIKATLGHVENIEKYVIGVLLLVGVVIFLLYRVRRKEKNQVYND
jgi:membrane protein DedA with SNARE-associated domain